jgi:hypothetical protein
MSQTGRRHRTEYLEITWHVGAALQSYTGPTVKAASEVLRALFEAHQRLHPRRQKVILPKPAPPILMDAIKAALVDYVNLDEMSAAADAAYDATSEFLSEGAADAVYDATSKFLPKATVAAPNEAELGQSNSAAERSAHVVRGNPPKEERRWPIRQLRDGSWRLNVVVEREEEILELRVALQEIAMQPGSGDEAFERARNIARTALLATCNGKRPVVEIVELGGICPVQAEGTIAGKPFYFRARGSSWRLSVGDGDPTGNPEWTYQEDYGENFEAGWMEEKEAIRFILQAADQYQATRSVAQQPGPVGAR